MLAELLGGPLDAAMLDGPDEMPSVVTIESGGELLMYRARCCAKCARWRGVMRFEFVGYGEGAPTVNLDLERMPA
jgi:hypothetical protein